MILIKFNVTIKFNVMKQIRNELFYERKKINNKLYLNYLFNYQVINDYFITFIVLSIKNFYSYLFYSLNFFLVFFI